MKKMLIVDDEYYFREGFKTLLPWEDYGYDMLLEAKNGAEALRLIEEETPDLMFLDISMPIMNGIELLRNLTAKGIYVDTVLLSGYSEFEYAKKAIQYGVKEYLLKPVVASDIKELFERLTNKDSARASETVNMDSIQRGIIRNKLFMDMVHGEFQQERARLFHEVVGIHMEAPCYSVMIFRIMRSTDWWNQTDMKVWRYGAKNLIRERFDDDLGYRLFDISNTDICCVLWAQGDGSAVNITKLKSIGASVVGAVYSNLGIKMHVGIGAICQKVKDIRASFSQAEQAVESQLLFHYDVIAYSEVMPLIDDVNIFKVEDKRKLLSALYINDTRTVAHIIHGVFKDIADTCASMFAVHNVISELSSILSEAKHHVKSINKKAEIALDTKIDLGQCTTLKEAASRVEQIYMEASRLIMEARPAKSTAMNTVEKTKQYIRGEYHRPDLSEMEIAKNMYVTRSYLCLIFKKETGTTIGHFLRDIRIQRAKELFKAGNTTVHYIAKQVGFADANYFSKSFKKQTGTTPSQYISIINSEKRDHEEI